METIADMLHCRVDVYAPTASKNALGEESLTYSLLKRVWVGITVKNGAEKNGSGNTVSAEITHRILMRSNAVPGLCKEMYVMYAGNRYDILYVQPFYRDRGLVECACRMVVE